MRNLHPNVINNFVIITVNVLIGGEQQENAQKSRKEQRFFSTKICANVSLVEARELSYLVLENLHFGCLKTWKFIYFYYFSWVWAPTVDFVKASGCLRNIVSWDFQRKHIFLVSDPVTAGRSQAEWQKRGHRRCLRNQRNQKDFPNKK